MIATTENEVVLLHVKEAAERLGVSQATGYRMVRDGELHAVKIRGSYRVHPDVIARFYEDARAA